MNDLISLLCILLSFTLLYIYIVQWKSIRSFLLGYNRNIYLFDFLMAVCVMKLTLYYCLPSVTHFILDWKTVFLEVVKPYEVLQVYIIEFFSYVIYLFTLRFLLFKYRPQIQIQLGKSSKRFVFLILILSLIVYLSSIATRTDEDSGGNLLDSFWFIVPFLRNTGIAVAIFVITIQGRGVGKTNLGIAICTFFMYLAYALSVFVRSLFFWPALLFIYYVYVFNRRYTKRYMLIALSMLLFLVVFQSQRSEFRDRDHSLSDISKKIDRSSFFEDLFTEIDFRFGAMTTYGTGFIRLYNRGEAAGIKPIENSLYAPIPRRFFEEKPIPCSADGTLYGMGMYRTMDAVQRHVTYSMVEPATGAHAYWEFGIVGIVILSIIPALYMFINLKQFSQFGLLAVPLFISVFKWEYMEPKLWVSQIIVQLFQINLPAYIFAKLFNYLCMSNRNKS